MIKIPSDNYNRDLLDARNLSRGGRVDLIVFQDVDNAGDGLPGMQRAMKNWVKRWLHDGVMDQALDLNNHGISNVTNINELIYYVSTDAELDAAITAITTAQCAGRIIITQSLTNVQATINAVNSSFIIEANGDEVILDANGDNTVFTITNCLSCTLRDFKIDATDITTVLRNVIDVTEASDNTVIIDNVTIIGDGVNGLGVDLNSDGCSVLNCNMSELRWCIGGVGNKSIIMGNKFICIAVGIGVAISGDESIISNNSFDTGQGINHQGAGNGNFTVISGNNFDNITTAIISDGDHSSITGNVILCAGGGDGISTQGDEMTITGNSIDNAGDAIGVAGDENVVVGNCCRDGIVNLGANNIIASNNDA